MWSGFFATGNSGSGKFSAKSKRAIEEKYQRRSDFNSGPGALFFCYRADLAMSTDHSSSRFGSGPGAPSGWSARTPRPEIEPAFAFDPAGGRDGQGSFLICGATEGSQGWWRKNYPVQGGHTYRVEVWHRTAGIASPRRNVAARILWRDENDQPVSRDRPTVAHHLPNWKPPAEAEYLEDKITGPDGWTEASAIFRAPTEASQLILELGLQWASGGQVEWSQISVEEAAPLPPRKVRLAAIHFEPRGGKTAMENCRMFEPLVAEAARKKADLVVLGEFITAQGIGRAVEMAEPIPGPSSHFLGELAAKHDLYLVAGLVEREGRLIYNTAVLLGPDGRLVGKYRKVSLPTSELEQGIMPGSEYPVFTTRFGRIGLMICFDGFFPEVAQRLAMNGAEVIAWPVYGCNPLLAAARACENQVYLVSSTYAGPGDNWGVSGIYDLEGKIIAQATEPGAVALAEVDLNAEVHWTGLGHWKKSIFRQRPG
jgi:predicted amidohydrolase